MLTLGWFTSLLHSEVFAAAVIGYVLVTVTLWATVAGSIRITEGRRFRAGVDATFNEVKLNIRLCPTIIDYAQSQKVGNPYAVQIPRFYTTAWENLRVNGYLFRLKKELSDELITIYSAIERVHAACDRQEELAVGSAATSPIAADLRAQSLTFIRDTVNNTVKPRLELLDTRHWKKRK